jgi:NAD(P)-dependent dehydrogenase (short-subunit alcohol dehydrogenase family)
MNMGDQQGVIVVTGASRGVGRAVVASLVKEHGRTVLAIARDAQALQEVSDECRSGPGSVEALPLDLAAPGAMDAVKSAVSGRRVVALINNAGLLIKRPAGEWTNEDLERIFPYERLLNDAFQLVQGLAPFFDPSKGDPFFSPGHVVNIGQHGGTFKAA